MTTTATNLALLWQQTGGFYRLFCLSGANVPATTQNATSAKLQPLARGNDG